MIFVGKYIIKSDKTLSSVLTTTMTEGTLDFLQVGYFYPNESIKFNISGKQMNDTVELFKTS